MVNIKGVVKVKMLQTSRFCSRSIKKESRYVVTEALKEG